MLQKKLLPIFISLLLISLILLSCSETRKKTPVEDKVQITKSDPWTENEIIMPETLKSEINNNNNPMLIQIGFRKLFEQNHIPGAIYAGPASKDSGIASLKETLHDVDQNKNIVLYCGCCELADCPNIRPAFKAVKEMGFKNAKILYLKNTFMIDWVDKGYPATR
jgi:thiosulfate/3-mercaptopyruvate sulfurtransferase